jgi:hypothetical protein
VSQDAAGFSTSSTNGGKTDRNPANSHAVNALKHISLTCGYAELEIELQ